MGFGNKKVTQESVEAALGINGASQGEIIYRADEETWALLPPGTSGDSLKSLGVGEDPAWDEVIPSGLFYYRRLGSTAWFAAGELFSEISVVGCSTDLLQATPFIQAKRAKVFRIGIWVTTGNAGVARLGIYEDNGNFEPEALVKDCGTVDVTTTGLKTIDLATENIYLEGSYWFALHLNATPNIRGNSGGDQPILLGRDNSDWAREYTSIAKATAYAALPDPWPDGAGLLVGASPAIAVQLVEP